MTTKKTTKPATLIVEPVAAPTVAVDAKKATKKSKEQAVVAPAIVVKTEPVAPKAAESKAPDAVAKPLRTKKAPLTKDDLYKLLCDVSNKLKATTTGDKKVDRELKDLSKTLANGVSKSKKVLHVKTVRAEGKEDAPSGFNQPVNVSDTLKAFLKKSCGAVPDVLSRSSVNNLLNKYIKTNNLQNKDNGRVIEWERDGEFKKLFNGEPVAQGESVTWFSMNRHLKHHFTKKVQA